jgi:ABC-2 type transport system permease protein
MRTSHVRTAVATGLREYARTPVLIALLLIAPAYLIGLFGYAAPNTPVPVEIPNGGQVMVPLADMLTILGVVLVAAMVGGLVGLFVVQSATEADGRLVIAGFDPVSLLLARGALLAVAATTTVGISMVVTVALFTPANVLGLAVAGFLTALIYSLVGVIVGTQVDRLAGVWILLFAPLLDVVLFQNPLATETKTFATVLPSHATMRFAVDAALEPGLKWTPIVTATGYLAILTAVAAFLYAKKT